MKHKNTACKWQEWVEITAQLLQDANAGLPDAFALTQLLLTAELRLQQHQALFTISTVNTISHSSAHFQKNYEFH